MLASTSVVARPPGASSMAPPDVGAVPSIRTRPAPSMSWGRSSFSSVQAFRPLLVTSISAIREPAAPSHMVILAARAAGAQGPIVGVAVGVGAAAGVGTGVAGGVGVGAGLELGTGVSTIADGEPLGTTPPGPVDPGRPSQTAVARSTTAITPAPASD